MIILDPKYGVRVGCVDSLDDMYREIGCDTIDITSRKVGGKSFDFIVDDEGLLKKYPCISAFYVSEGGKVEPALVGTLIICSHDAGGNTVDISLDDHMLLANRVTKLVTEDKETGNRFTNYVIKLD